MVLFLCDKKKCENCSHKNGCMHTTDIEHAVNFKKDDCGDIVEQPALLEAKESFTGLVKELNGLLEKYIQLRAIRFPYGADFDEVRNNVDEICKAVQFSIECVTEKIGNEVRGEIVEIQSPELKSLFQEFIKQREGE